MQPENFNIFNFIRVASDAPDASFAPLLPESRVIAPFTANESSSLSGELLDTDVLSSDESTSSRSSWPAVFHVPKFSHDAELKLP